VDADVVRRDYHGTSDLPEILRFCQRIWTVDSRWHIGDLAWDIGLEPDGGDEWRIAIWEATGAIVGVGWLHRPDRLSVVLDAGHASLVDNMIAWADDFAEATVTVVVLDTETALVRALERAGRTADRSGRFFVAMHRDLDGLPPMPALPAGYLVRPIRDDELSARAELHRAIWSPELTDEMYAAMTRRWPYRREFDLVAQAPDGALVAYILGWYDDVHRVGEFEPVGTLPAYRRLGLSRAVGVAMLHAFRSAGGERAVVYARGDDEYPIPRQVYGSLGFAVHGRHVKYR
jgi:ribosomal protein S18 acetylase RimI-like enzyme